MKNGEWTEEFPAAMTVCDADGVIVGMNKKACETFAADGGERLLGSHLLDCHKEPARTKVAALLEARSLNVYTIEKAGITKLIYQSPWFEDGKFAGFVELSLPIPAAIPHFIRDTAPRE